MAQSIPQRSFPRIVVIGPGALGTLFAARLQIAGAPTTLLDYRPARAATLHERGLRLRDAGGEQHVMAPVTADPRVLAQADIALVLVKAYRTEDVAALLAESLPPSSTTVTLQNGLGNVETLQMHLGPERVFGGTTAQGASLEDTGVVRDTGAGPITLGHPRGEDDARLDAFAAALLHAGFTVTVTKDLHAALWTKAILNAAINPVAALTRLCNGKLAEHEPSLALMTAAAREASAVARRQGIHLGKQDWRARLLTICQATASNTNSMLADVLQHRRTEIDAITGAIVRAAELRRYPTPVNRTLWYLVKTIEEGYGGQVE